MANALFSGDQTRPDLFDLKISTKPGLLYDPAHVIEADERVSIEGWSLDPSGQTVEGLLRDFEKNGEEGTVEIGISGDVVRIFKKLGV